jgi:hypothetical protein
MLKNIINNCDRIIYLLFFMILTVFLLGAGQVTHELWQRNANEKAENGRWSEILTGMSRELPDKHRASWKKLSEQKSEILIRATYILYSEK